jgi:2-dehydro-3-deoxy-D-arabinonate dehydratase
MPSEVQVPLCHYRPASDAAPMFGIVAGDRLVPLSYAGLAGLSEALGLPAAELQARLATPPDDAGGPRLTDTALLAPLDRQEVWAAGVTYLRSRDARMEESSQKSVYDLVYDADRPELFLKATPDRVRGPGQPVAIRGDSTWDVPEPELALVVNSAAEIVGYTIGNDVSSRSIEGENPLYLPQAKVYTACAALGPTIVFTWELGDLGDRAIELTIRRGGAVAFSGATSTGQIHRALTDLVAYLFRCNEFPRGVVLMTGTGIVPPADFTLEAGDEVEIAIAGLGRLRNPVVRLPI